MSNTFYNTISYSPIHLLKYQIRLLLPTHYSRKNKSLTEDKTNANTSSDKPSALNATSIQVTDTNHNAMYTSSVSWVAVYNVAASGGCRGEKPTCNLKPTPPPRLPDHQYWIGTESPVSLCWKVLNRTDPLLAGPCILYLKCFKVDTSD